MASNSDLGLNNLNLESKKKKEINWRIIKKFETVELSDQFVELKIPNNFKRDSSASRYKCTFKNDLSDHKMYRALINCKCTSELKRVEEVPCHVQYLLISCSKCNMASISIDNEHSHYEDESFKVESLYIDDEDINHRHPLCRNSGIDVRVQTIIEDIIAKNVTSCMPLNVHIYLNKQEIRETSPKQCLFLTLHVTKNR